MRVLHTISQWIGHKLAQTSFVKKAIDEQADLSAFKEKPSARLVIGLVLIALSFVVGWPAVGVCGIVALSQSDPRIFIIGGPAFYAFSWLVWGAGMVLMGVENYKYSKIFFRWLVRRMVERLTQGSNASTGSRQDGA